MTFDEWLHEAATQAARNLEADEQAMGRRLYDAGKPPAALVALLEPARPILASPEVSYTQGVDGPIKIIPPPA